MKTTQTICKIKENKRLHKPTQEYSSYWTITEINEYSNKWFGGLVTHNSFKSKILTWYYCFEKLDMYNLPAEFNSQKEAKLWLKKYMKNTGASGFIAEEYNAK